jgi:hypothetical protein
MKLFLEIEDAIWSNFDIQHFDQRSMDFEGKLEFGDLNLKGIWLSFLEFDSTRIGLTFPVRQTWSTSTKQTWSASTEQS